MKWARAVTALLLLTGCAASAQEAGLAPSEPPPEYRTNAAREPGGSAPGVSSWSRVDPGNDRLNLQSYFLTGSRWPAVNGAYPVAVCWENPTDADSDERAAVQEAVAQTWAAHSRLRFIAWGTCPATTPHAIRIRIEDVFDNGPRTLALGTHIEGVASGMTLNFTFQNWGKRCARNETERMLCIRSIGVHEFGHAIGFAHEHNRHDRPGECMEPPQGDNGDATLTPYDRSSVMDYCNSRYNNLGVLSECDRFGVQAIYGVPVGQRAEPPCRGTP